MEIYTIKTLSIMDLSLDEEFYSKKEVDKHLEDLEKRSIIWSVNDFESQAKDRESNLHNGETIYDREKFEDALETMIHKHDCSYGITWDHIDHFLEARCKIHREKWWGYLHTEGTLQVKRFFTPLDTQEAKESPFCKKVIGPFLAIDREDALTILKNELDETR